jgi:hypothetical protein
LSNQGPYQEIKIPIGAKQTNFGSENVINQLGNKFFWKTSQNGPSQAKINNPNVQYLYSFYFLFHL